MSREPPSDRLPPRNPEAELGICGVCILDPDRIPDLREIWFDTAPGQKLFEALTELAGKTGALVNELSVAERLKAAGIQEAAALVFSAVEQAPTKHNFSYWRDILEDLATRRAIIRTAEYAAACAHDNNQDLAEILSRYQTDALQIGMSVGEATDDDNRAALAELVDDYEAAANGERIGIPTGFSDLDRLTGGLRPGQLFVLAARPSVGKTSLALNIAENLAVKNGLPVGFWSLEMTKKELLHRLTCSLAEVNSADLHAGRTAPGEIERLTAAQAAILKAPLRIVDRSGLTVGQLATSGRRMLHKHKIKLGIVDYLGLLRCGEKHANRYEEITLISGALKGMAKALGIPLLVLAQLNRDSERQSRTPELADLRDSGSIEQDADLVGLLQRLDEVDHDSYTVELSLKKNRTGRTGRVDLFFQGAYCRFRLGQPQHSQRTTR